MNHEFFVFYCILYNRKKDDAEILANVYTIRIVNGVYNSVSQNTTVKLLEVGYRPIYIVLEYLLYQNTYRKLYNYHKRDGVLYEDKITIDCNSITGIKMQFINDPYYCMKYMIDNHTALNICKYLTVKFMKSAIRNNHQSCFYLLDRHIPITVGDAYEIMRDIMLYGRFEMLKCNFHYRKYTSCESDWNAAINGHINCLELLIKHRIPLSKRACAGAAAGGKLECLMFLHNNRRT